MEAIDKNKYISKIEVVRILQKAYAEGRIKANDGCVSLLDDINAMPAAEVQPVKHGRWITKAEDYYKKWQDSGRSWDDMPYFVTGKHIACSECFTEYDVCTEGIEHWTGCPCCLARMDGEQNEV